MRRLAMNDGGPAFPAELRVSTGEVALDDGDLREVLKRVYTPGMTLRDWFAGKALESIDHDTLDYGTSSNRRDPWPDVAAECYRAADAMLAERSGP
jgi:hypothetical protein